MSRRKTVAHKWYEQRIDQCNVDTVESALQEGKHALYAIKDTLRTFGVQRRKKK